MTHVLDLWPYLLGVFLGWVIGPWVGAFYWLGVRSYCRLRYEGKFERRQMNLEIGRHKL